MIDLNRSIESNIYHEGHIYYCSRNGLFHQTYSKNHIHEIIAIPRPSFLDKKHLTKAIVIDAITLEFNFQYSKFSHIPENIRRERIIKGWEKWVPELLKALNPKDIKELQDEYWSLITTFRIGVIKEITSIVKKFENEQKSTVLKGELHTVDAQSEKIKVNIINNKKEGLPSKEIYVDMIINCLGRETDYNKIENTLWRQLIENGMVIPHKMTGRGVETTWLGTIIDKKSNPISSIMAVGVMRDGDETQRNGRLGSFVFSIGPIRNNALQTATSILLKEQIGKSVTNKIENACEQKSVAEALRCVVGDTVDETTLIQLVKCFDRWVTLCISSLDPSQARLKSKKKLRENITSEIACIPHTTQLVRSIVYGCAMLFAVREICDIQQVTTSSIEEDIND